jgi:hypothetical protein
VGIVESTETNVGFCGRETSLLFQKIKNSQRSVNPFNDRPLQKIIAFAMTAMQRSITIRWGLLDAGGLVLVLLALVDGVPSLLSELLDMLGLQTGDDITSSPNVGTTLCDGSATAFSLPLINSAAARLLLLLQAPQFQVLLHSEIFATRGQICSSLLETFLGDDCGVNDVYSDTRKVCTEILQLTREDICEFLVLSLLALA